MSLPYEFQTETIIKEGRANRTALKKIKNWLKTTNIPDLQDETIVLFLISCKNDSVATQSAIQAYFKIKSRAPDLFRNRDIDSASLTKAINVITCCFIPRRMDNTLIVLLKLDDTDYRNFSLADSVKLGFMLADVSQRHNPPDDVIIIIDLQGVTLMHLTCVKLNVLKNFIDFEQYGMPLKINNIHILNANYVAEKALAICKLFMNNELVSLMKVHSTSLRIDEFHQKWVPAAYLPKEYGGDLPTCRELTEMTILQFQGIKPFFEAEEKLISSYKECV